MARNILLAVRWTARVSGLLLVGVVLAFVVGEGPPNPFKQPLPVRVEFLGMSLALAGFLVGWRWEALGGGLAVCGCLLFLGAELAANGRPPGGVLPLLVVPGVLFLIGAALAARVRSCPGP